MVPNRSEFNDFIEVLRQDLVQKGLTFGFNSEVTLSASKKLDYYIYLSQKQAN